MSPKQGIGTKDVEKQIRLPNVKYMWISGIQTFKKDRNVENSINAQIPQNLNFQISVFPETMDFWTFQKFLFPNIPDYWLGKFTFPKFSEIRTFWKSVISSNLKFQNLWIDWSNQVILNFREMEIYRNMETLEYWVSDNKNIIGNHIFISHQWSLKYSMFHSHVWFCILLMKCLKCKNTYMWKLYLFFHNMTIYIFLIWRTFIYTNTYWKYTHISFTQC